LKIKLYENIQHNTEDGTGERRKLYNVLDYNVYISCRIIRVNKLRRVNWTGHSNTHDRYYQLYKISVRKPKGNFQMGETYFDKRVILILVECIALRYFN
jgi:hypothetical protein